MYVAVEKRERETAREREGQRGQYKELSPMLVGHNRWHKSVAAPKEMTWYKIFEMALCHNSLKLTKPPPPHPVLPPTRANYMNS